MYTYKLALLVSRRYRRPRLSSRVRESRIIAARRILESSKTARALKGARSTMPITRQIHPPPSPSTAPAQDESSPSPAKPAPSELVPKDKRQIHNADYQVNSPPPSPNHGPAQDNPPIPAPPRTNRPLRTHPPLRRPLSLLPKTNARCSSTLPLPPSPSRRAWTRAVS
ncbi:hypothetical protein B0H14DRAFT_2961819 [Mycena olivaceomarginata]|nr:hypothetical protein B0H14DRAFT_2961819 [Mycena olivaceomarginata]